MKIRWIGQSGYVIKTERAEIMLDPYLSDAVNRAAGRPRLLPPPIRPEEAAADAVICTHAHLDHLDTDALKAMPKGQYIITTSEGIGIVRRLGFQKYSVLRTGESVSVKDVKITAVFAKHTVETFGVLLRTEKNCLYFSSDTLYDERLFSVAYYHPDMAFLCINGKLGNMNVEEAILTAEKIGAKINVPNHYGMFASNTEDPGKFTAGLRNGFIMEYGREYDLQECLAKV